MFKYPKLRLKYTTEYVYTLKSKLFKLWKPVHSTGHDLSNSPKGAIKEIYLNMQLPTAKKEKQHNNKYFKKLTFYV